MQQSELQLLTRKLMTSIRILAAVLPNSTKRGVFTGVKNRPKNGRYRVKMDKSLICGIFVFCTPVTMFV